MVMRDRPSLSGAGGESMYLDAYRFTTTERAWASSISHRTDFLAVSDQVAPVVPGLVGLEFVATRIVLRRGSIVLQVRLQAEAAAVGCVVVTGLEEVACVVPEPSIEQGLVHLFDRTVQTPMNVVQVHVGEAHARREHTFAAADLEEDLFAQEGGIAPAVGQVELLQPVIDMAADELIEVELQRFLVRRIEVEGAVALEPHADAIRDVCARVVRDLDRGRSGDPVPCVVVQQQLQSEIGIVESEPHLDNLVGIEERITG